MDKNRTERARERVEKIFQGMSEEKGKTTPKKNAITLDQIMEESGININEVTSPKFSKVMKNMGEEELLVLLAFKSTVPLCLLQLNNEELSSISKIKELAGAYEEMSQVYTYALIKMTVIKDISNISTRDEALIYKLATKFELTSLLEQKTLCLLANFCNSILGVTMLLCNEKAVESVNNVLGSYVMAMRETFLNYVKKERAKNGLKED